MGALTILLAVLGGLGAAPSGVFRVEPIPGTNSFRIVPVPNAQPGMASIAPTYEGLTGAANPSLGGR